MYLFQYVCRCIFSERKYSLGFLMRILSAATKIRTNLYDSPRQDDISARRSASCCSRKIRPEHPAACAWNLKNDYNGLLVVYAIKQFFAKCFRWTRRTRYEHTLGESVSHCFPVDYTEKRREKKDWSTIQDSTVYRRNDDKWS